MSIVFLYLIKETRIDTVVALLGGVVFTIVTLWHGLSKIDKIA